MQAGHFNDFIEVSLLRGAIYRAVENAGESGLRHDEIAQKVFDALDLPARLYAINPDVHIFGVGGYTVRAAAGVGLPSLSRFAPRLAHRLT